MTTATLPAADIKPLFGRSWPLLFGALAGAFSAGFCLLTVSGGVEGLRKAYSSHIGSAGSSSTSAGVDVLHAGVIYLTLGSTALVMLSIALFDLFAVLGPAPQRLRQRVTGFVGVAGLLVVLKVAGDVVFVAAQAKWPSLNGPGGHETASSVAINSVPATHPLLTGAVSALGAAVGEEVCALAFWVWAAQRLGLLDWRVRGHRAGLRLTAGGLVVLRITYHLYLGPHALFFLPWAIGTVWVYLRTRRLLPVLVAHFVIDFTLDLDRLAGGSPWVWLLGLPLLLSVGLWALASPPTQRVGPIGGVARGLRLSTGTSST